jgi:NAD(P)-dependent dehydrogenase (short-subunit alcohol dehydrogenase family)
MLRQPNATCDVVRAYAELRIRCTRRQEWRSEGPRDVLPSTSERRVSQRFSAQVALIAGGTGALGCAVTLAFLGEGALSVVTYRQQSEFDALRQAAGPDLPRLEGSTVDVTDEPAVRRLVAGVVSKHGRLDVLVNTVGGYTAGRPLWDMDAGVLPQMLSLNLTCGYVLCRAVVPAMLRQNRGTIVNVASMAAVHHAASSAEYAASKSAAVAMIDSMAADLSGTGVRANSILPSIIDTEANRKAMPGADYSKWPKPQEIARVILFLCSDDARLIHGASIPL